MKRKLLFVGVAVVGAVLVLVAGSPVFADCYRVINCNHYTNACNACGGDGPFPCGVRQVAAFPLEDYIQTNPPSGGKESKSETGDLVDCYFLGFCVKTTTPCAGGGYVCANPGVYFPTQTRTTVSVSGDDC